MNLCISEGGSEEERDRRKREIGGEGGREKLFDKPDL